METNNFTAEEQASIENYFQEPAIFVSKRDFPNGRLIIWKNTKSLPSRKACTFSTSEDNTLVPNANSEMFDAVLLAIRRHISDVEDMCSLLTTMSPYLRKVIKNLQPYMKDISKVWHAPTYEMGRFEAFVENLTSGMIEKFLINETAGVAVEVVGTGIRFDLR